MQTISRNIDFPIKPGLKSPWDLSDLSIFRYFICPEVSCAFIADTETPFTQHMTDHHEVFQPSHDDIPLKLKNTNIKIVRTQPANDTKPHKIKIMKSGVTFDCQSCGYQFSSIIELRKHIEKEHPELKNPLLNMENVIITPHAASGSSRMRPASRSRVGNEIVLALSGKWPMSIVNPSVMPKVPLERWQPYPMQRGPNR